MQEVNCVELKGTIRSELKYDHQDYYGTKFYYTKLVAKRLSEFEDTIPILISDDLLESKEIKIEDYSNYSKDHIDEILEKNKLFVTLKEYKESLKGKCQECTYKMICGGCRATALALKKSLLEEDPLCLL